MDTILAHFGHFFELFAALNIGYAGSEKFRLAINKNILHITVDEYDAAETIYESLQYDTSNPENIELRNKLKIENARLRDQENTKYEIFKESRKKYATFKRTYKGMFFSSAIFCILLLLITGFEQIYEEQTRVILLFSHVIILWILVIFISAFTNSKGNFLFKAPTTIQSLVVILIIFTIGLLLSCFDTTRNYLSAKANIQLIIWLSILTSVLPYGLFFWKAFLYRRKNKSAFDKFKEEMNNERPRLAGEMTRILCEYAFKK